MPRPSLLHPPPDHIAFLNALRTKFRRPLLPVPPQAAPPPPKPPHYSQLWLGSALTNPRPSK